MDSLIHLPTLIIKGYLSIEFETNKPDNDILNEIINHIFISHVNISIRIVDPIA